MTPEALSRAAGLALRKGSPDPDMRALVVSEVEDAIFNGADLSTEVERFIDRYGRPDPAPERPLTAAERDRLLIEAVMGVTDSEVPSTHESRKLRRLYRKEVREARKLGLTVEVAKD